MSNFIEALQAATAHAYKGEGKNGAAIKAAAEEGYKSTDLREPKDKRSTCTEAQWVALKLSAAEGLTEHQFEIWTDFFAIRPTDYSKANEGEDFEDIW